MVKPSLFGGFLDLLFCFFSTVDLLAPSTATLPRLLFANKKMTQDPLDNEVVVDHTRDGNEHDDVINTVEISNEWSDQRDNLANAMFNEFNI
ncbi:hypothetical protein Tco_1032618 [Tanacetum coccineum]|uniref:Uncharacterized protein n=1 Tax=Tanacetum coccineum TaxID=301880 RepID=A0ABQ5GEF7_9ASTR